MTLHEWVEWGAAQLQTGAHPTKARLDAQLLLLHHLGKNRAWIIAHGDETFAGCSSIGFAELIRRRAAGEPIQYIIGTCDFYGLKFQVTPDVLIPRPETELLVEHTIERATKFAAPRIVDVGTGSGAIAIALAHALPCAALTSIDISPSALVIARQNALSNGCAVRFIEGDVLAPVAEESFDIVVSNPPYIPLRERGSLDIEVREHEPARALFAGEDGLEVYRRLIPAAFTQLTADGFLMLEIGHGQQDAIEALLRLAGFRDVKLFPDLQGIPRVACARRV